MNDERRGGAPDVPWRPVGSGMPIERLCMGCDRKNGAIGGRGVGVRWRCAGCIRKREAA